MRRYLKLCLNNEQGISLIPVMILLFIATIIGIAASTTSNFEIKIAANDRMYKRNFIRADGANQIALQLIQNEINNKTTDVLRDRSKPWITARDTSKSPDWYIDINNWQTNVNCESGTIVEGSNKYLENTQYMVVDQGTVGTLTEISMGSKMMHAMSVYGRYDSTSPPGRVIIETEFHEIY